MANYLLTQTGEEVQVILNQAPETEAGLQQEVTNREQAITAEQQAREQAIAAEATAREQAIAAEATAREQAVSAEATVRADADDALDTKIDAETTRAVAAEGTLTDAINKEVTDRTAAVAAEATARQQADTTLQQAISTEAQARSTADTEILGNLQTEARTRLNADTDLQEHIDDEEERAKAAEATLQANIDTLGQSGGAAVAAERERAEAAEGMLDAKIDAETDRAEAAEGTLNAAIAQEVTDRTAAVSAEATARADADAALQTAINGKQATIADLADIRSGAAAGATAYQKPATGIPATDMSSDVQTSLDKADTALQEHQSLDDYYTKSEVDNLITTPDQEYVSVTATAQTTAVTDLLPSTGAADTLYRVGNWDGTQYDPTMYALFAWNGTTYVCLAVRSFVGEVYDVSVNHPDGQGNPTPYADLTAALGTDGANIPVDIRRGGMSIKFIQGTVQSSDNKYVRYNLLATSFTTNTTQWAIDDAGVYVENPEFVEAHVDKEDKILYGVKQNGDFYFGAGVPSQVQEELDNIAEVAANKVDNEEGKSLIDANYASSQSAIDNSEYLKVTIDSDDKILEGIKQDGTKVIGADLEVGEDAKILGNMEVSGVSYTVIENSEYIAAWIDAEGKVVFGFKVDGKTYVGDADFLNDIKDNQENINRLEEFINSIGLDNIKDSIVQLNSVTNTLSEDVELLKSHSSGGVSFSTNFILSDSIQGNDLFIQNNTLIADGGSTEAVQGYSSTSFVNIMGIIYLEYDNLHAIDIQNGYYPIFLYDKDFNYLGHADVVVNQSKNTAGSLDLSVYPTAAYAIFCNDSDANLPSIQMFTRTEKIKNERNNILVGAYYFAGWSEIDFPNIHHTEALLNEYNGRKPIWGWLDHASFKGEGWLITPQINLNGGTSELTIVNSCLFYTSEQCKVCVREVGNGWIDKTPVLPSATKSTMSTTTVDISEFAGKSIQVGFKLKTSPDEQSAIWTINRITVTSNGSSVYDRDYTDHSNFDCEITDSDVWKPATWTRAYSTLNGYVGTTVNQKDTSRIDKQIMLAKQHGIDYFMLEWFYYDDQSTFNEQASYNEDNHIAVHAFMNSCQKLGFKFAVMISNHSPFRIVGLQNWKDAIAYLNREYFKDPSYLVVDNKPVIYIFDKTEYRAAGPAAINDYFIELGWSGAYVLFTNYNAVPNTGEIVERDITDLYNEAKQWNINTYKGNHQYNFVAHATCGWDSRPWAVRPSGYARPTDWFVPDISKWKNLFDWLYRFAKVYNNGKFKALLICAWNEYGEGSYLAPTEGDKRGQMLITIGDTINKYKY